MCWIIKLLTRVYCESSSPLKDSSTAENVTAKTSERTSDSFKIPLPLQSFDGCILQNALALHKLQRMRCYVSKVQFHNKPQNKTTVNRVEM